jgi:anthranilate phosphoribosyltransferase
MTTLAELGGWPAILRRLVAGFDLEPEEAAAALTDVLAGTATPGQTGAFIVGLRAKGETVDELSAMVGAMLDAAERVTVPVGLDPIDTCGTGGSVQRREACFNASTLAALVAAGGGATVCKHGGRAATATSSSAGLLEALGVAAELGPTGVARCLDEVGMAFCFAPRFHPAMRHAAPVRRELGIPTVFNLLGPMSNPAGVRRQVLGVADPLYARTLAAVLKARGAVHVMVVSGHDGLDELTTTTTSTMVEVRGDDFIVDEVDPETLGMRLADPAELRCGDTAANADAARRVLDGEAGARRDIVLLNAAAGLVVAGVAGDLAGGVEMAADSIDSGKAAGVLDQLVAVSQAALADESGSL